jgi:hypothetical protein
LKWLGTTIGPKVPASTAAANSVLTGCIYNSTTPTMTNGYQIATQCDGNGYNFVDAISAQGAFVAGWSSDIGNVGSVTAWHNIGGGVPNSLNILAGIEADAASPVGNIGVGGSHIATSQFQCGTGTGSTVALAARTGVSGTGRIDVKVTNTGTVPVQIGNVGVQRPEHSWPGLRDKRSMFQALWRFIATQRRTKRSHFWKCIR